MLAELAAFNAAYATVKTVIANGKEISDCMQQLGVIVGAKEDLQKKLNKKRSGFLGRVDTQTANDFEEFAALEKIKEAEQHLKEQMIWAGRPGMWRDWQRFQTEARKRRRAAEEERARRAAKLIEYLGAGAVILGLLGAVGALVIFVLMVRNH